MELHVITILCLCIASVWDLKHREVPDFLSYTFIGSVAMIALYQGAYSQLLSALVLLAIGWAFVYGGAWGGADAKLLPLFAFITVPYSLEYFLVLPVLFTTGALYGIVWVIIVTLTHSKGLASWLSGQDAYWLLSIPTIILLGLVSWPLAALVSLLIVFTLSTSYLYTCEFSQSVPFQKVVPGDWLMVPLSVDGVTMDGIVTEKDARKIHVWGYQGLVDRVQIKYGIPFIPAFLFTYLLYHYKDYVLSLM